MYEKMTRQEIERYFNKPIAWINRVGQKHGRILYCATFTDGTDTDFYYYNGEVEED